MSISHLHFGMYYVDFENINCIITRPHSSMYFSLTSDLDPTQPISWNVQHPGKSPNGSQTKIVTAKTKLYSPDKEI